MIVSKEVKVKWNPKTRKYYEDLGYIYTKHNDEFTVSIDDLHKGSNMRVTVACDCCKDEKMLIYKQYNDAISNNITGKYYCNKCSHVKSYDEAEIKQSLGQLKKEDNYYYWFIDNIKKELNDYIVKNKSVMNLYKEDKSLYLSINKLDNITLKDLTDELGYNWNDISDISPYNYYKDFENVRKEIQGFINKYGYFPTTKEIAKELSIQSSSIAYHGGIYEIKRKMNYNDNEYIDDSGFINNSKAEYFVAQFLIKNNIPYKREQLPFTDRYFRCDFFIETTDNEKYYIEVWGFEESNNPLYAGYAESRKEKEYLYNEYKLNLISIEYLDLDNLNYEQKQKYLIDKFNFINDKELIAFEDVNYLYPKDLTNDEIYNIIMQFSKDNKTLPVQSILRDNGLSSYLTEIRKRFKTYHNFGRAYNKSLSTIVYTWNEESVYSNFKKIIDTDLPINTNSINEFKMGSIMNYIDNSVGNRSFITTKLNFYKEYLRTSDRIHKEDVEFIINISMNKRITSSLVKKEDINLAKDIIEIAHGKENLKVIFDKVKHQIEQFDVEKNKSFNEKLIDKYVENFMSILPKYNELFPINFNELSTVRVHSYTKTFKMNWFEVLDKFNKKQELIDTLINEFKNKYYTENMTMSKFIKSIGFDYMRFPEDVKDKLWKSINSSNNKIKDINTLDENFYNIKNKLSYIPLYSEFNKITKHTIHTYYIHLNLPKNSYDEIVKYYSTEEEYQDYLQRKKEYKSEIGRQSNQGHKYALADLETEFRRVFETYYSEHNTYPSMREFNELSKFDDSLYRKRYGKKFSEVVNDFGYLTKQQCKELARKQNVS